MKLRSQCLLLARILACLVDAVGLEPTMPEAEDLQSPGVTNFPTHPKISATGRIIVVV